MVNENSSAWLKRWAPLLLTMFALFTTIWIWIIEPNVARTAEARAIVVHDATVGRATAEALAAETEQRIIQDEKVEQRTSKRLDEQSQALVRIEGKLDVLMITFAEGRAKP